MDSLILCKFLRGVFGDFYAEAADMLQLVTGWNITAAELRVAARRIVAAKKHFNILAGWTHAEDTLPERFLSSAPADDPRAVLSHARLQSLVRAYNHARGWTEEGFLPAEVLDDLRLSG
jgi:aldehyde:ferredoxin oxidoreductase